jgi:hypothetical protein
MSAGLSQFEDAARFSLFALWSRRSSLGLVGGHIDIMTGVWNTNRPGHFTMIFGHFW